MGPRVSFGIATVPRGPENVVARRLAPGTSEGNKTSFFLCLIPSLRHDTALVSVAGGLGAALSSFRPCWVMNDLRIVVSVPGDGCEGGHRIVHIAISIALSGRSPTAR